MNLKAMLRLRKKKFTLTVKNYIILKKDVALCGRCNILFLNKFIEIKFCVSKHLNQVY